MQTRIVMPQLGESVTEGTVDRWLKREGDWVEQDEPFVEVVTDKVNSEVPSPVAGRLAKIAVAEGQTVPCGTEIALIDSGGAVVDDREAASLGHGEAVPSPEGSAIAPASSPVLGRRPEAEWSLGQDSPDDARPERADADDRQERPAPPVTSGTAATLLAPAPGPASPPAPPAHVPGTSERTPLTATRRAIADHLTRSVATVPQATIVTELDLTAVARLRERAAADFRREHGIALTYLPFFLQAVVAALRAHPELNVAATPDDLAPSSDIHLGLAVARPDPAGRPGGDSVVVPVIRHADRLSLRGLALAAADLAERTRAGALTADETRGATFTANNTGSLGSVVSAPILPLGQVGIVTLEAIVRRPVVATDADGEDTIAIRHRAYSCLTFDQGRIDVASAGRFVGVIKAGLEGLDPRRALDLL